MMARIRRRVGAGKTEVSMSSMIDVVFLLLIFFIVVHKPIVEEALFKVKLPADQGPGDPNPNMVAIDVVEVYGNDLEKDSDSYMIRGKVYKLDEVRDILNTIWGADDTSSLIINCGPNAQHEKLVRLMDCCNHIGVKNLSVISDESIAFRPK